MDDIAEMQMNEASVTQPTQVPLELREMIINSTKEDPPTRDTQKTTHISLPTHSLSDVREMQMADPIIRRFHFYWSRNQKPNPQERRRETKDTLTLLNQWDKISEENVRSVSAVPCLSNRFPASVQLWDISWPLNH